MIDQCLITRRQVLGGLAIGLAMPVPSFAGTPVTDAYVQESGKPGQPGAFILGALFTTEPGALAGALAQARRQTGFHGVLRHSATNRGKADYARAAVAAFLEAPSARFVALVAAPDPARDPAARQSTYHARYTALLRAEGAVRVHKAANRTVGAEAALDHYLALHVPSALVAPPAAGDIAQLAAFLTGSVAAARRPLASPVKSELVRYAVARLEASDRFTVRAA